MIDEDNYYDMRVRADDDNFEMYIDGVDHLAERSIIISMRGFDSKMKIVEALEPKIHNSLLMLYLSIQSSGEEVDHYRKYRAIVNQEH